MKQILLVDDNAEFCSELAVVLQDEGYGVESASDSALAVTMIQGHFYDIYILDYKMKGLNGIDLLKIIKGVNPVSAVFIISGESSIESLIRKEEVNDLVSQVIIKPFKMEELLSKIRGCDVNKR